MISESIPVSSAQASALPHFPIVIVRDIPLLVVGGYVLRGLAQSTARNSTRPYRVGGGKGGLAGTGARRRDY
jgi:hypothetical protein